MQTSIHIAQNNGPDIITVILGRMASGFRDFASLIYSAFVAIQKALPELLAWIILMPLLISVGFILTLFMFPMSALIAYGSRKVANDIEKQAINNPESFKTRSMMLFLHKIEIFRAKSEDLVKSGSSFYVFRPINMQFEKAVKNCLKIEQAVTPILYPQNFTLEQAEALTQKLKEFETDWNDKSMEIYN